MHKVTDLLLYDPKNALKVVGTCLTEKLKEHALCGGDDRPGLAHPFKSHLTVKPPATGDGICADPDIFPIAQQVKHGLLHTDMRLDAGHDNLRLHARRDRIEHLGHARAEVQFLRRLLRPKQFPDTLAGRPQPGRILLCRHTAQTQCLAPADQLHGRGNAGVGLMHGRQQFLLQIDDEQHRLLTTKPGQRICHNEPFHNQ